MTTTASCVTPDSLAAIVCGDPTAWPDAGLPPRDFVRACQEHGVTALLDRRVRAGREACPPALAAALTRCGRASVAAELSTAAATAEALDALAANGVVPVLFKGTALAYAVYDAPHLRPRGDTDVMIRPDDYAVVQRVLAAFGYVEPVSCQQLLGQARFACTTAAGVEHALDVHWRISSQSAFADLLTYDELAAEAIAIPALGPRARAAGRVHALLLACVHPVMHHRNADLIIWCYDIHLLASQLTAREWLEFPALACRKHVGTICAQQLARAAARFHTTLPEDVLSKLAAGAGEPTAEYLSANRGWLQELVSNVRHARGWRQRLRLFRDVFFPDRDYMFRSYGVAPVHEGSFVLSFLHLLRLTKGLFRVATGLK